MKNKLKTLSDNMNYFFASDAGVIAPKVKKIVKNPARMKLSRQKIEDIPMFTTVRADNFQLVAYR